MKLATLNDGSRDGQLVVVSRDLASAHLASDVAGTLQAVLDDWNFLSPQLEDLYATLNGGKARHAFAFDPQACLSPLPRAHLWAPEGGLARSDGFLRPQGEVALGERETDSPPAWQVQLAAVTGDVAAGADDDTALDGVRLLMLSATFGPPHAVHASAFGPVAVTPDELGSAWQAGRLAHELALQRDSAEQAVLAPAHDAPGLGRRIASLARTQALGAGSLVGGPAHDAGGGWSAGSRLRLQLKDSDALGTLSLRAPAAQ